MESRDSYDELLKRYFVSNRKKATIEKAQQIRLLQRAVKMQPIESITFWRFVSATFDTAKVKSDALAQLAAISPTEADLLTQDSMTDPFALRPSTMANILLTLNLHLPNLRTLLENTLIAQNAAGGTSRAVARSSESLGGGSRTRLLRDGLNSLFIQLNKEARNTGRAKIPLEQQHRLTVYLSEVIEELKRMDAEYLSS